MSSKPSFYIQYGFSEGKRHGVHLRAGLKHHGFVEVSDSSAADILIAHSGGCYLLPSKHSASLVLLVGIPMNDDPVWKTIKTSQGRDFISFKADKLLARKLIIQAKNVSHLVAHPARASHLARKVVANRAQLPLVTAKEVVVIANQHDPWVTPLRDTQLITKIDDAFISLPGSHDHLWQTPSDYVKIVNYYAARLFT